MAVYQIQPRKSMNGDRPTIYPFQSRGGWQSSYRRWFRSSSSGLIDSRGGVLAPVTLASSPTTSLYDGSQLGRVARSENGGGNKRAFTSPSPCPLDGLTSVTLVYWVYLLSGVQQAIWGQGTGNSCFCETSGPGGTTGPFWRGGTDHRSGFTEVLTAGVWQLAAWSANSTGTNTTEYYLNGALRQSKAGGCGTITAAGVGESFYIGGEPSGTGAATVSVDAYWADFRVYPWALSAGQHWELYNSATRWSLYEVNRPVYFDFGSAPASGYLLVKN